LYHEGGVGLVFGYGAFTLSFNDYFDFSDGWGHAIEAGLGYTVSEKFPLCLEWYSFLWMPGYETKWDSYAQVSYPLEVGDFTFTFAAGVMPFNTDYYGNYTGFNLSLLGATAEYTFDLGRGFSLPLKGEILYNNIDKKPYGALTVSFYFDK
ncbi:MAG: hypothetical protein HUJ93_00090, partial [Bacteroidales bacterium]|nr:hypothetical protein [Bacteroidales bacterium]